MIRLLFVGLCAASSIASAQSGSKKELVARLLEMQQPGLEALARGLAEQPAAILLQQATPILRTQIPPERREAVAKTIDDSTKRYFEEAGPLMRDRALKLAPTTVGAAFESKLSEDELRQLIAWFDSPINRKYQQMMPAVQAEFTKALVADARPAMDSKLKTLEQSIGNALGGPGEANAAGPGKDTAKRAARKGKKDEHK